MAERTGRAVNRAQPKETDSPLRKRAGMAYTRHG